MNLGERVKKLRKKLGLTQTEFASRVPGKIDYTYIGKIEKGQQYPSLKMLERIGRAYNMPLGYFFENEAGAKKRGVTWFDILKILVDHRMAAESRANKHLSNRQYLMYGHWKSIAEYTGAITEDLKKLVERRK